jgi:hypothetical protein
MDARLRTATRLAFAAITALSIVALQASAVFAGGRIP